jgi:hypothetical protein
LAPLQAIVQRPPRHAGLKTGPWTGKGVVVFVKHACGRTISAATTRRYLRQLGFGRKWFVRGKLAAQHAFAQDWQQVE